MIGCFGFVIVKVVKDVGLWLDLEVFIVEVLFMIVVLDMFICECNKD